jgi:hypothetical protein
MGMGSHGETVYRQWRQESSKPGFGGWLKALSGIERLERAAVNVANAAIASVLARNASLVALPVKEEFSADAERRYTQNTQMTRRGS